MAKGSPRAACAFEVSVLDWDPLRRRVFVMVKTSLPDDHATHASQCLNPETGESRLWSFWVDEFDFPQITFTRLSEKLRFALVLSNYSEPQHSATIDLVFFPSSRRGARPAVPRQRGRTRSTRPSTRRARTSPPPGAPVESARRRAHRRPRRVPRSAFRLTWTWAMDAMVELKLKLFVVKLGKLVPAAFGSCTSPTTAPPAARRTPTASSRSSCRPARTPSTC